ncbi:hypothetical protein FOMPIDRAFT_1055539 [Fomitopsis schrenkii]|uniref:PARP catalytic domain-containing protein n=1 Tax=Fomitopsis schrenkii TaxID=2126942 RepID=S8DK28_FOMSC|nr:hypothetical protein FOMPIDRAFT_1055539 [Fomitopsis schrenkii]
MKAYIDVAKQFRDQWRHPTRVPTVVKARAASPHPHGSSFTHPAHEQIWKIFCDNPHNDEFARYRLSVERARGLPSGNSKRRWHGTIRACTVGDADAQGFACNSGACSLCGIIRTSFRVAKAGQNTNFGRFGAGIYTSATLSKANSYVVERGGSPYKAVLLSDVVLGKVAKLRTDKPRLTEAPAGYDSVIGEPGRVLNYDEAIVYKNEAIRPLFLVIYKHRQS